MSNAVDNPLIRRSSYINGMWKNNNTATAFAVFNPATEQLICHVATADAKDARAAIAAASTALPAWRSKTAKQRSSILRCWFELIHENIESLAELLTAEQGKPLAEARAEISYGADYIEWFAEESKRIYGDHIPAPSADKRIIILKQPIGVVSAITPWNFPNAMITRKVAPALAAGCTIVVKASEETPLSALALAELAHRAGIPAGVLNIIASDASAEIGKVLTTDPRVQKFSFTGSTAVGKILLRQCASTVKKTSMELGGNAPFIVFDDADVDEAVAGLMLSKFRNAGQTCVCTNRVFVHSSIYDEFSDKLVNAVNQLRMGDGFDNRCNIGPMINSRAVATIHSKVTQAVNDGAAILCGGQTSDLGESFYQPTVVADVTPDMRLSNEEIFGPVAPLIKFESEEQLITMANDTNVGLASYFYSRDIGRVWRVAEALEFGMVGINDGSISNEMAPFGGVKESGMGREGSKYGIEDYLEIKYLCMGGIR